MFTPQHTKMQRSTSTRKPQYLETVSIELLNIQPSNPKSSENKCALYDVKERFLAKFNING